jgi:chromosome segregation ATPase
MADSKKVKDRYFNAINELYPKLRSVPSVRQLVAFAGGSNSTAEKYIHAWCTENSVEPPSKEKKKLAASVEEAIETEIEQRTLEACSSYSDEVARLESSNLELREETESLRDSKTQLELHLRGLESQNSQLLGQVHQLEKEVEAARAETRLARDEARIDRESAEKTIEVLRIKALEADDLRRKAETELAAFPEVNKRAETDQLIAQVLARALEREAWFESRIQVREETSAPVKRGKLPSGSTQSRGN